MAGDAKPRIWGPWVFGIAGVLFLVASGFDLAARHHYLRATIDLMLGCYCGLIARRIWTKEKQMTGSR